MSRYRLFNGGCHDAESGGYIPDDPDNVDWREFLAWKAEGNVPDPVTVRPPPTAEEVLHQELRKTDAEMLRGFDWLLQHLVQNGTIEVNDIPPKLKALYQARKAQREA